MSHIYTPLVQIKIGDPSVSQMDITTVPPQWLKEFSYNSTEGGYGTISASFFDPTYEDLEALILSSELKSDGSTHARARTIGFRVGLDYQGKVTWTEWINTALESIESDLTEAGQSIMITAYMAQVAGFLGLGGRKTYTGKRSDVVKQVADEAGMVALIEETNDAAVELVNGMIAPDAPMKTWSTKNRTVLSFLNEDILKGAKSAVSGAVDYTLDLLHDGKTIIFAPRFSSVRAKKTTTYEVSWLAGKNDVVKSFKPDFKSDIIGSMGVSGYFVNKYNPNTKKFTSFSLDQQAAEGTSVYKSLGKATHVTKSDPNSAIKRPIPMVGVVGKEDDDSQTRAVKNWVNIAQRLHEGVLTLHGVPELLKVRSGDYFKINTILPSGRLHYSSGLWRVEEAKHSVTDTYEVICKVIRDAGLKILEDSAATNEVAQKEIKVDDIIAEQGPLVPIGGSS